MDRAIIFGSGPSLTAEDADVAASSGWPLITVNSSWQMVPDCDVIYAGDLEWWEQNYALITSDAARWTCHPLAAQRYRLKLHVARGSYNSGMRAIQFAVSQGARRILLLGFDCCTRSGTHWHGDHPAGLRNPVPNTPARWLRHFESVACLRDVADIINCSRITRLTQFRRMALTDALALPSGDSI
ncbi:hypothetical protein [Pantoea agglomerans]|uniref:hypothetical protein n=1 Tax=Enterobacter agglomerans TaxID=549 RepID=UPI0024135A14|nr:hypothetical protein [Pantoea agglomerans]